MTEDLQPRIIAGPPRYHGRTDHPIEYVTVELMDGTTAGYLYANDADGVVGWMSHPAAGHAGHSAYYRWLVMLRGCKERGLAPTEALDELARIGVDAPADPRSRVVSRRRQRAESVGTLRQAVEGGR